MADLRLNEMKLGIGTWSWGDTLYWGYGKGYQEEDLKRVFHYCLEKGITFFDTAEIYGQGRSETFLGKFSQGINQSLYIASKFMPFPWRLNNKQLDRALEKSLQRLQRDALQLYQIHMPLPPLSVESWMEAMIRVHEAGLIEQIGVSNYSVEKMQKAQAVLLREGIGLATNQVEYHLLNRRIEKNGLMVAAKDSGIRIIAYSPLAMGVLSGKYNEETPPSGFRGRKYNRQFLHQIKPLLLEMGRIGVKYDGKSIAQVAINWVIAKGAIPIPGVKNLEQAQQNIEAANWTLSDSDIAILDALSDKVLEQ
ncbi:MAG: aldo/keto reductase [Anaerolineaceae bacterium]|nr:aldo/keto reductase [Anaerolineaceae bacterium]